VPLRLPDLGVNPWVGRDRLGLMADGFGLAAFALPDRFLDGPASPFRINLLPDLRSCLKA
jgi:hypothetical protein